jgi:hypothetical protein
LHDGQPLQFRSRSLHRITSGIGDIRQRYVDGRTDNEFSGKLTVPRESSSIRRRWAAVSVAKTAKVNVLQPISIPHRGWDGVLRCSYDLETPIQEVSQFIVVGITGRGFYIIHKREDY